MLTEFEKCQADLIACTQNPSQEDAHMVADAVLCRIAENTTLTKEEREELVSIWDKVHKWYS